MTVLLFRLNNVPEDEADEVRELLTGQGIDFYETDAGRWGISVAAIWLDDESRLQEARRLIDEYQRERAIRVRNEYDTLKNEGRLETLGDRFRREPVRFVLYTVLIALVIYLTLLPFLHLG